MEDYGERKASIDGDVDRRLAWSVTLKKKMVIMP